MDLQEARDHFLVYFHDDAKVVKIAIIGGRENSDEFAACEEVVTILLYLMGAANQVQIVLLIEVLDDDLAERVADAAIVLAPVYHVLFGICWVRPK